MITKEMRVTRVAAQYPATLKIFSAYGINCMSWGVKRYTLEQAAQVYRIELSAFLRDLNSVVK